MGYFEGQLAKDDLRTLVGIRDQLAAQNMLTILRDMYAIGEIDRETYAKNLHDAYTALNESVK